MNPLIVIGASGRVARRLRIAWSATGTQVLWVSRSGGDLIWPDGAPPPPCPAAKGAVVLVLAGVTPGPDADFSANVAIATRAAKAARGWGAAHILAVSTSAIYGPTDCGHEDADIAPKSAYAQAKQAMERAISAPDVTTLRLANIAGASQPFLNLMASAKPPVLDRFADGLGPSRSFVGPVTLARIITALADHIARGTPLPGLLNIASPPPLAMADIVRAWGHTPLWRDAGPDAVQRVHLDTARLAAYCPLPPVTAADLVAEIHQTEADPPR